MPLGANQGWSSYPGYYGSDQVVYSAGSASKISTVVNGQNVRGTSGGAILGIDATQLQNTRLFTTKFNYPYLGQRDLYNDNKPQIASTINGVAKAISAGTFSTMVAGKYIVLGINSGQVAGITTGLLSTIMNGPGGHYNVVGQNLAEAYRNTWLKRISGGWYYQTGQPVNAQYSRDKFGTDTEGTGASPGRIVFNATGNNLVITKESYQSRYGS